MDPRGTNTTNIRDKKNAVLKIVALQRLHLTKYTLNKRLLSKKRRRIQKAGLSVFRLYA